MNAARWEQVKQIVADALEMGREARPEFLERVCASDAELRSEVETLLRVDDPDSSFLDLDRPPAQIGAYRVVREIGRGGMGTVYLAERSDGQFERQAAIKVIKRGMDSDSVLRRFFAERQILARLHHPNITRLFDGGMFDGRPYFVMEALEGEPLVEYCRRKQLSVEQRIRLFLPVCDAVEYAHRNLVLHRDLKASNILVDASGTPKLLDFGIAKLLEPGAAEETTVAWRPLTPQAASPEQVRNEPLTTASDVYALGLLLFELLADRPAYRVSTHHPLEMARLICEEPVVRPSSVAPAEMAKQLRGDLDNIALRALEKDPALRYQRAADLADDLRRNLDGLPVLARPTGGMYRARKFVGRHRRSLAIAAVAVLAISAAATDAVLQGRRASRRFEQLRQLSGSFLFEFHDAIASLPGATPARELVIRRGLQYLDILSRESSGDIDLKKEVAEGYLRIGTAQGLYFDSNLGQTAAARASFEKASGIFEEVLRKRPHDADAAANLGKALLGISTTYQGKEPAHSLEVEHRVIALLQPFPGNTNAQLQVGNAYLGMGESLLVTGKPAESQEARQKAIAIYQGILAKEPGNGEALHHLAQVEKRLAFVYITSLHRPDLAMEPLQTAMRIDAGLVEKNPSSATAKLDLARDRSYLATILERKGDIAAAQKMLDGVIALHNEILRVDPRNFMVRVALMAQYSKLARLHAEQHQSAESRAAVEAGLKVAEGFDAASRSNPSAIEAERQLREMGSSLTPRR